jgi:feruloyl-CoA synthase
MTVASGQGREIVSYGEALHAARALHGSLAAVGLKPGARVATLLAAGREALVLRLACLLGNLVHVTLPPRPFRDLQAVPPDTGEAERIWRMVRPDLLILPAGSAMPGGGLARRLADLPPAPPLPDCDGRPADWTAIFFTAGSTGAPKGVPITRGMIASCQAACVAVWPFLAERPPVLIDWMPWNHVFGGLDNLFKIIWNGGTLHLMPPPLADGDDTLIALMEEVRPTLMIGVPLGLRLMLDAGAVDPARLARGCTRLGDIFIAGAAMDPALWDRLQAFRTEMADVHGRPIRLLSGYGATEAASTMCLVPGPVSGPGWLGWPLPGHEMALVDTEGGSELRFRGPNLAPCYLGEDGPFPLPLDAQGYYCSVDAGVLDTDPEERPMLRFDGRLSEDFKLSSGIKVRAGTLRGGLLRQLGPEVQDLVLGGAGREALVALVFPAADADAAGLVERLSRGLAAWNARNPASSTAIARFALATIRPSVDAGEVSAKGQLVQSRILRNHAPLFAALSEGHIGRAPAAAPGG